MNTPLLPNETVIKEGLANATRGIENVGGKLYLTNQRLIFESHQANIQTGSSVFELRAIIETGIGRALFLNLFRLTPNMFYVVTDQGKFEFVVNGRKAWQQAVDTQRSQAVSQ